MAIEPLLTGTALVVAAAAPVVLVVGFKAKPFSAFVLAVVGAMLISEVVFRFVRPGFLYGPLYGLGFVIDLFLASFVAGFVTLIVSQVVKR